MPPVKKRDDNWIDGLRGVASFVVVTGHLLTAFLPVLHSPSPGSDKGPMLFQLPILRLCVGGRPAVAVFFLVTGFVNSMGPMKHFANGNTTVALPNLARSAFMRSARLVLPTNAAALVAWVICQLGGFNLARVVESDWVRGVANPPGPTLWEAIKGLCWNMTLFWNNGVGSYDPTHWAVVFFLKGSMRIYLTLLATSMVKTRWRVLIILALHSFCWWTGDYITGINIYAGMLLAQVHTIFGPRATNLLPKHLPTVLIVLGFLVSSYPQYNEDWIQWSRFMKKTLLPVLPQSAQVEINRYWVSVGVCILATGIFTSRGARSVLTSPLFNFLGRVSFAVYLLHDTLLRTVLVWMVYGPNVSRTDLTVVDSNGQPVNHVQPAGGLAFAIAIPVFYAILYAVAHVWTKYVDAWCANAVVRLRDAAFQRDDGGSGSGPMEPLVGASVVEKQQLKDEGPVLPLTNGAPASSGL
ncbi:hypothetical protein LOZ36_006667 [Ophidiomyces ophidiicola]|nr:hypothetical protein LOZ36_006667 [Ophidiomyces ophidiicola]